MTTTTESPPAPVAAAPAPARRSFAFHRNVTFASLLVGYAGYYLCRQNLSAAGPVMEQAGVLSKEGYGWVVSLGTLAYAVGKLTTGAFTDARPRFAFVLGLVGAVLASVLMGVGRGVAFFAIAWSANRFFQSMGWGGLVNVVARWFPKRAYGTAMGLMSISYQGGSVVAPLVVAELIAHGASWPMLFWVPAGALAALGLGLGPCITERPELVGHESPRDSDQKPAVPGEVEEPTTYVSRLKSVLADRAFWVMAGLCFVLTLLRQVFQDWTPASLK